MNELILEKLITLCILIIFSLFTRFTLQKLGQQWVTTLTHTSTFFLLPPVTFFVTSVISGNIALSLGMVGALSIVRFRHPVRSPLELTVYFILISAGIIGSVSIKYLMFFTIVIFGIILCLKIFQKFYSRFTGKDYFGTSYIEHTHRSILAVQSKKHLHELANHDLLDSFSQEETITYRLISEESKPLKVLAEKLSKQPEVLSIQWNK